MSEMKYVQALRQQGVRINPGQAIRQRARRPEWKASAMKIELYQPNSNEYSIHE